MKLRDLSRQLREQLISLSIELSEKEKLLELYTEKIQSERATLTSLESVQNTYHADQYTKLTCGFQSELEEFSEEIYLIGNRKADYLTQCKCFLEQVTSLELTIGQQVRRLNKDSEVTIESEHRSFRDGHRERMQKRTCERIESAKEITGRALEPEISRLQISHQRELTDIEVNWKSRETDIREEYSILLRQGIDALREDCKTRHTSDLSVMTKSNVKDCMFLSDELKQHLGKVEDDLDSNFEKIRLFNEKRNVKERKRGADEVQNLHQSIRNHIAEIRMSHNTELLQLSSSNFLDTQSSTHSETSIFPLEADIEQYSGLLSEEFVGNASLNRERILREEIKYLQGMSCRYERRLSEEFSDEERKFTEASAVEERNRRDKIELLSSKIADLAVKRDKSSKLTLFVEESIQSLKSSSSRLSNEIDIYSEGIATYNGRATECQRDIQEISDKERSDYNVNSSNQLGRILSFRSKKTAFTKKHAKRCVDLKSSQGHDLDTLNEKVKSELEKYDKEIEELIDCLNDENVKLDRLEAIFSTYSTTSGI